MTLPGLRRHRRRKAAVLLGALALALISLLPATAGATAVGSGGAATTDTSPVNLSAKVDMAAGKARQQATVVAGDGRFAVLAPDVVRLEYSPTGSFLDQPTFTILNRDFAVPPYTATRDRGWLTIRTSAMVLRYRLGSGAFSTANTQMSLLGRRRDVRDAAVLGMGMRLRPGLPVGCRDAQRRRRARHQPQRLSARRDSSSATAIPVTAPPGSCSARPPAPPRSLSGTPTTSAR